MFEWAWILGAVVLLWIGHTVGKQSEQQAAKERAREQQQRDIDLGIVAPVAVLWAAGKLDEQGAVREIERCSITNRTALSLWHSMSKDERTDLALRYAQLTNDPHWQAQRERDRKKLDAVLEQAHADTLPQDDQL